MSAVIDDPDAFPLVCGRCYEMTDILFPPPCDEKPETRRGEPIGMYHCPDCGAMLIAGVPHPLMCMRCRANPGKLIGEV